MVTKYKRELIVVDSQFLTDPGTIVDIKQLISNLSNENVPQSEVDTVYEQYFRVLDTVMDRNSPKQVIKLWSGTNNKNRRRGKPWWVDWSVVEIMEYIVRSRKVMDKMW